MNRGLSLFAIFPVLFFAGVLSRGCLGVSRTGEGEDAIPSSADSSAAVPEGEMAKPAKLPRQPLEGEGAKGLTQAKMEKIIIPVIDFEDTSVEEAIDFLRQKSVELDPERESAPKGVSFVIRKPREDSSRDASREADAGGILGGASETGALRIKELHLRDISLWAVLHRVAEECGLKVEITAHAIELRAK